MLYFAHGKLWSLSLFKEQSMDNSKWIEWARQLQSIAQAGLHYSKDIYDIERFERIREISAEMLAGAADMPIEKVRDIFLCEKGYQTPKVDVRAAIIKDEKILLVRENDGRWSMPGGWADVGLSAAENAVKESREEAGAQVAPCRMVALLDWQKNNGRGIPAAISVYKVFILCSFLGGSFEENIETTESGWFPLDALPELGWQKNTPEQVKMCFDALHDDNWTVIFD